MQDTLEVTVTALRFENKAFRVPEAVSIVTQEELESNVSRSMAEALIGKTGVWMQKTNHGGGSPFVRGLTGNQTLLLLDGVRLNNSTYRYGPNQYFNTLDPLNVSQIEVVRGAGSVLYGSDALGGTIQVLTKSPEFSEGGWDIHGSLTGRWISNDMEYGTRAELELAGSEVAILGGFTYRDFGDLLAGGDLGVQAPSAYQEKAGDFKLLAKVGQSSILTLAYNGLFQSNVGRYDQVAQRGYSTWAFDPQNRQLAYGKLQIAGKSKLVNRINILASWQNSFEGRVSQRENADVIAHEEDEINTLGTFIELYSKPRKDWTILTGLEYYQDWIGSSAFDLNTSTSLTTVKRGLYPDDSKASSFALFHSHTIETGRLLVNTGLRFNIFSLNIIDAEFGDTNISPSALVGNISASYYFKDNQAITGSVNTGFRAPNINDMSTFGRFDSGIEVPSQDLSPEKSLTFELGYKVEVTNFQSNLSIYHTSLFDLIGRVRSTYNGSPVYESDDVFKKENIANSYIQGLEWNGQANLTNNLLLSGSFIYTYGQNTTDNEPMRRIPPLNGRVALQFQPNDKFYGELEYWYASKQSRLAGGDKSDHRIQAGGTPGWEVFNFRLGYQFSHLSVNGGIQNILNEAYRIHGSGLDGVGRSYWLSTKFKFWVS